MFGKGVLLVCMPCGGRGEHGQLETPTHPRIHRSLVALGIAKSCSENAPLVPCPTVYCFVSILLAQYAGYNRLQYGMQAFDYTKSKSAGYYVLGKGDTE